MSVITAALMRLRQDGLLLGWGGGRTTPHEPVEVRGQPCRVSSLLPPFHGSRLRSSGLLAPAEPSYGSCRATLRSVRTTDKTVSKGEGRKRKREEMKAMLDFNLISQVTQVKSIYQWYANIRNGK